MPVRDRLAIRWTDRAADRAAIAAERGDVAALDRALKRLRRVLRIAVSPEIRLIAWWNLSLASQWHYELSADPRAALRAVTAARQALSGLDGDDERLAELTSDLGQALLMRWEASGDDDDLREALSAAGQALRTAADDSPLLAALVVRLGSVLTACAEHGTTPAALGASFEPARHAVARAAGQEAGVMSAALAQSLCEAARAASWHAGLTEAAGLYRAALEQNPGWTDLHHELAVTLLLGDELSADEVSVSDALDSARQAMTSAGSDILFTSTMVSALVRAYELTADGDLLDEAVERGAILGQEDDPDRLSQLAVALDERAKARADPADARRAVDLLARAVDHPACDGEPAGHLLLNLGNARTTLYELTGERHQIRQAVSDLRAARATVGERGVPLASVLSSLSLAVRVVAELDGRPADLDESVRAAELAVAATGGGEPGRPGLLVNLALALLTRFEGSGRPEILDEAIGHARTAVDTSPADGSSHGVALDCLSDCLLVKYETVGELALLEESIDLQRRAIPLPPTTGPAQAARLADLATLLCLRHEHSADPALLATAVDTARRAITVTSAEDPDLHLHLQTLARVLREQFLRTRRAATLDEAIIACRQALERLSTHDTNRPTCLVNLGADLLLRQEHGEHGGNDADRTEAAELLEEATGSPDATTRALAYYNLALAHAGNDASARSFRDSWSVTTAPPSLRAEAAVEWGRAAAAAGDWTQAAEAFGRAVELLPMLTPRHLDRGDQEHLISLIDGAARDAVACLLESRTGTAEQAVELLELGRAVLLDGAMHPAGELQRLRAAAPELAARFDALGALLGSASRTQYVTAGGHAVAYAASQEGAGLRAGLLHELDDLTNEIRSVQGWEEFLRPPSAGELRAALRDDLAVLVNVSRYRSDAIIMDRGSISVIPLPEAVWDDLRNAVSGYISMIADLRRHHRLPPGQARRVSAGLAELCGWLWNVVARPILEGTGRTPRRESDWPRLWWCPTGPLALLPVHAAHARDGGPDESDGVDERVVSSYIPALRTLAAAHRHGTSDDLVHEMLIVEGTATAGTTELSHIGREVTAIAGAIGPDARTLTGRAATCAAVMTALPRHPCLHYVGHSRQDLANPGLARMYLHDGELTALDLAGLRLATARLAFLSSCEGALGGTETTDEPLHLALACLAAGYRDVVATLWPTADRQAVDVAEGFYRRLTAAGNGRLRTPEAARALHATIRALRRTQPPEIWAAYVHVGG